MARTSPAEEKSPGRDVSRPQRAALGPVPVKPESNPPRELTLLIQHEPWLRNFLRNFADLFRPAPPKIWLTSKPSTYWSNAILSRHAPWTGLRRSVLFHALLVLSVYWLNELWLNQPRVAPQQEAVRTIHFDGYQLSPYLPPVSTHRPRPVIEARRPSRPADPERAPQEIISMHVDPSSLRQTVVQPDLKVLDHDIAAPNLVAVNPAPLAAPVVSNLAAVKALPLGAPQVIEPVQAVINPDAHRLIFPAAAPAVVPPAGELAAARPLNRALPLSTPSVVEPAQTVAGRRLSSLRVPTEQARLVVPPMEAIAGPRRVPRVPPTSSPVVVAPSETVAARRLSAIRVPAEQAQLIVPPAERMVARHAIPVAPPTAAAVIAPVQHMVLRNLRAMNVPPAQHVAVQPIQRVASAAPARPLQQVSSLLVLNARPAPPVESAAIPEGSRKGQFVAGPDGHAGASATPEVRESSNPPEPEDGDYVAPPPVPARSAAMAASAMDSSAASPVHSSASVRRTLNSLDYYPMVLNVPNFSSSYGSWKFRFVKLQSGRRNAEDFSGPAPLQQVDPAYSAVLIRDGVEGTVLLHALIRSDGSVADVQVLEGAEERLDANVSTALSQWRFRPAMDHGIPVEVEAVVSVSFRIPHKR